MSLIPGENLFNYNLDALLLAQASFYPLPDFIQTEGWSHPRLSDTDAGFVHGPFGDRVPSIEKTFALPPHTALKIQAKYWTIDSWDRENAYMEVNDKRVWMMTYRIYECGTTHGQQFDGYFPNPWAGDRERDKCCHPLENTMVHNESTITLRFGGQLGQSSRDESWAVSDIRLFVDVEPTAPEGMPLAATVPATSGELVYPMQHLSDGDVSYVGVPDGTSDFAPAKVTYFFEIQQEASSQFAVQVKAPSASSDEIQVSVDGSTPQIWAIGIQSDWTWVTFPSEFALAPGAHRWSLLNFEDGLMIRNVHLTAPNATFCMFSTPTVATLDPLRFRLTWGTLPNWNAEPQTGFQVVMRKEDTDVEHILLKDSTSLSGPSCDFEKPCSWTSSGLTAQSVATSEFGFLRHKGSTPTDDTGPTNDITIDPQSGAQGYYMYTKAQGNADKTAYLTSPAIVRSAISCKMSFWYNMNGLSIQTLSAQIQAGAEWTELWSLSGDQGTAWMSAVVDLGHEGQAVSIRFAVQMPPANAGEKADVAIDSIHFSEGCAQLDVGLTAHEVSVPPTSNISSYQFKVRALTGSGLSSSVISTSGFSEPSKVLGEESICTFEDGFCLWSNPTSQQQNRRRASSVKWARISGHTYMGSRSNSGPLTGVDVGDTALDDGETFEGWVTCATEGRTCDFSGTMEIRYGASGEYVDQTLTDGTECTNTVFGDPVPGTRKYCMYRGTLTTPSAPGCYWYAANGCPRRNYSPQWRRDTWGEANRNAFHSEAGCMGRKSDYDGWCGDGTDTQVQWNKPAGLYAYVNSWNGAEGDYLGDLVSAPLYQSESIFGVQFRYMMYGREMGTLQVDVKNSTSDWATQLSISGNQGRVWKLGTVRVATSSPFQIRFRALRGSGRSGDIALDNVLVFGAYPTYDLWSKELDLINPSLGYDDRFGYSTAIGADLAVIGARHHDSLAVPDTGAAFVLHNNQGTWVQDGVITPDWIRLFSKETNKKAGGAWHYLGAAVSVVQTDRECLSLNKTLIYHLTFSDASSLGTDSSSSGYNGYAHEVNQTEGHMEGKFGANFEERSSMIVPWFEIPTGDTYTISAWVKFPTSVTNSWRAIVRTSNEAPLLLKKEREWGVYSRTKGFQNAGSIRDLDDGWHHFVVVVTGPYNTDLYVDSNHFASLPAGIAQTIKVVGNSAGGGWQFGTMSDLKIWDDALTPEEVDTEFTTSSLGNIATGATSCTTGRLVVSADNRFASVAVYSKPEVAPAPMVLDRATVYGGENIGETCSEQATAEECNAACLAESSCKSWSWEHTKVSAGENIAVGKPTEESSSAYGSSPSRVVDGNTATNWGSSTCTHTNNERKPWWRVDLEESVQIQTVTVYNRGDCCGNRLKNFEVRVGDSEELADNEQCGDLHTIGQGESEDIGCNGLQGRYTFVGWTDNRRHVLTLCEVEIVPLQQETGACPDGYSLEAGSIEGAGTLTTLTGVVHSSLCGSQCGKAEQCKSFEYSATAQTCNLNIEASASAGPAPGVMFCRKAPICCLKSTFMLDRAASPYADSGYPLRDAGGWVKEFEITPMRTANNFGSSLHTFGSTMLIVGSRSSRQVVDDYFLRRRREQSASEPRTGQVDVYRRVGYSWTHTATLFGSDCLDNDGFGMMARIDQTSGNQIIVGAPYKDTTDRDVGAAYIFSANGELPTASWRQEAKLFVGGGRNARAGNAIAISGSYAFLGAPTLQVGRNRNTGGMYVFKKEETNGTQQCTTVSTPDEYSYQPAGQLVRDGNFEIDISVTATNDVHIALSSASDFPTGDKLTYEIVVGGSGNSKSCVRNARQGDCRAETTSEEGFLSTSGATTIKIKRTGALLEVLDADGSEIVSYNSYGAITSAQYVGVSTGYGSTGEWSLCVKDVAGWGYSQLLLHPEASGYDAFGTSISVDGNYAMIGANKVDEGANDVGANYIYKLKNSAWEILTPLFPSSHQNKYSHYGYSNAMFGNLAITGGIYQHVVDGLGASSTAYMQQNDKSCGLGNDLYGAHNGERFQLAALHDVPACEATCSSLSSCAGFVYIFAGGSYSGGEDGAEGIGACFFRTSMDDCTRNRARRSFTKVTGELKTGGVELYKQDRNPPGRMAQPLVSEVTSTTALLSWATPWDRENPLTGYQVLLCTGTGSGACNDDADFAVFSETSPASLTYEATGLCPGTVYTFKVSAVNDNGAAVPSTGSVPTATPRCGAAGCPSAEDSSVTEWSDVAAGTVATDLLSGINPWQTLADGADHWVVVDIGSCKMVSKVTLTLPGDGTNPQACSLQSSIWSTGIWHEQSSLEPSSSATHVESEPMHIVSRFWRLVVVNDASSVQINRLEFSFTGLPSQPGQPVVSGIQGSHATLSWELPALNPEAVNGYAVYKKTSDESDFSVLDADTGNNATLVRVHGLLTGTSYEFKVAAHSIAGTSDIGPSSGAVTTVRLLESPTVVSVGASTRTTSALSLVWQVPTVPTAADAVTGWVIKAREGGAGSFVTLETIDTTVPLHTCLTQGCNQDHIITGLTKKTLYEFQVHAVNNAGTGAASSTSAMMRTLEGCVAATTCSGHGTCNTGGLCDCEMGYFPTTPVDGSGACADGAQCLCLAALDDGLMLSPTSGKNTGGYTITARFQGMIGSVGTDASDVAVVLGDDAITTFDALIDDATRQLTGVQFTLASSVMSGPVAVAVTFNKLGGIQREGSFVREDPSTPLYLSNSPIEGTMLGGAVVSIRLKYWQTEGASDVVTFDGTPGTVMSVTTPDASNLDYFVIQVLTPEVTLGDGVVQTEFASVLSRQDSDGNTLSSITFTYSFYNPALVTLISAIEPTSAPAVGGSLVTLKLSNLPSTTTSADFVIDFGETRVAEDAIEFEGFDAEEQGIVKVTMPLLQIADDQDIQVQVAVNGKQPTIGLRVLGYQARIQSYTPQRYYANNRRTTMTFYVTNWYGDQRLTTCTFGEAGAGYVRSVQEQDDGRYKIRVNTPKVTVPQHTEVKLHPGGVAARMAVIVKETGDKVLPTMNFRHENSPELNSRLSPSVGPTTGGDRIRVNVRNIPYSEDLSTVQISFNGVVLDDSAIEISQLQENNIWRWTRLYITSPAVDVSVTSPAIRIALMADPDLYDEVIFVTEPPKPVIIESITPSFALTTGTRIRARILNFGEAVRTSYITSDPVRVTAVASKDGEDDIALEMQWWRGNRDWAECQFYTPDSGMTDGMWTFTFRFLDSRNTWLTATVEFEVQLPPLLAPSVNRAGGLPATRLQITQPQYANYYLDVNDKDSNVTVYSHGQEFETWRDIRVRGKNRYLYVLVPLILSLTEDTTIMVDIVSAPARANATFELQYKAPPQPEIFYQNRDKGSQLGGLHVRLRIKNAYEVTDKLLWYIDFNGTRTETSRQRAFRQAGRYDIEFYTPQITRSGDLNVYVKANDTSVSMQIPWNSIAEGQPEVDTLNPSSGWTSGGKRLYLRLKNKPGGTTYVNVTFPDGQVVHIPDLQERQRNYLGMRFHTVPIAKDLAGVVQLNLIVPSGDMSGLCGCDYYEVPAEFTFNAMPDPTFAWSSPRKSFKSGGKEIRFRVNNLGFQLDSDFVVTFANLPATITHLRSGETWLSAKVETPDMTESPTEDISIIAYWSRDPTNRAITHHLAYDPLAPRVTRMWPESKAMVSGGVQVHVWVKNFDTDEYQPTETDAYSVYFAGVEAMVNRVRAEERRGETQYRVQVIVPRAANLQNGTVTLTISLKLYPSVTASTSFEYVPLPTQAPQLISVDTATGDSTGGTRIRLELGNFVQLGEKADATVQFGDGYFGTVRWFQSTTIKTKLLITSPAVASGGEVTVSVYPTSLGIEQSATFEYTYIGIEPEVTYLYPASGYAFGGYQVRIKAKNLPYVYQAEDAQVLFGGVAATIRRARRSGREMQAWVYAPEWTAESDDNTSSVNISFAVRLTEDEWSAWANTSFEYISLPSVAEVRRVSPTQASARGGRSVYIHLKQFWPPSEASDLTVTFGTTTVEHNNITWWWKRADETKLRVIVPEMSCTPTDGTRFCTVPLQITCGSSTATSDFKIETAGMFMRWLSPTRGQKAGRQGSVYIQNLEESMGDVSVTMNGETVSIERLQYYTRGNRRDARVWWYIHFLSGISESQDITTVVTAGSDTLSFAFPYIVELAGAPEVETVSPSSGTQCGETTVHITFKNPPLGIGDEVTVVFPDQDPITSTNLRTWGRGLTGQTAAAKARATIVTGAASGTGLAEGILMLPGVNVTFSYTFTPQAAPEITRQSKNVGSNNGGTDVLYRVKYLPRAYETTDVSVLFVTLDGVTESSVAPTELRWGRTNSYVTLSTPTFPPGRAAVMIKTVACGAFTADTEFTFYDAALPRVKRQSRRKGSSTGGSTIILNMGNLPEVEEASQLSVKFGDSMGEYVSRASCCCDSVHP